MARDTSSTALASAWRLLRAGPRRQALVAEAVVSLASARIKLAIHPFSRVAEGLGAFSKAAVSSVGDIAAPGDAQIAHEISWAVRATARRMPFRAVCLQQALAARAMLRRRGIDSVLHLGAGSDDSSALAAHAWLDAAGARVTGYPIAPHIVEIGCFT